MFPTKIVVSYKNKEALPYQMEVGKFQHILYMVHSDAFTGVEKLCEVESDLSRVDERRFKEKK